MSNPIYTSERVLPYVYMGTHKTTGQFYIGSRTTQKLKFPSHIDLGTHYFTSSKRVKDEFKFENFNWIILAEFFESKDAFQFEHELIGQNIKNKLCLNKHYNKTGKWNTGGTPLSETHKQKIRNYYLEHSGPFTGRHHTIETKRIFSEQKTGITSEINPNLINKYKGETKETLEWLRIAGRKRSKTMTGRTKETHQHIADHSEKMKGRERSEEYRQNISKAAMGSTAEKFPLKASKFKGETKETNKRISEMAEKHKKVSLEDRKIMFKMKNDLGYKYIEINEWLISKDIIISWSTLTRICKNERGIYL